MPFTTAHISHPGGRSINQDAFRYVEAKPIGGCWIVADGLGGHGGGEVAASLASETIKIAFSTNPAYSLDALESMMEEAQQAVLEKQQTSPAFEQMRTTLVVLLANATEARWAHIGDSRLYLFRKGKLLMQTKDHSVVQALVDAGSLSKIEARSHEDRNRILRSVGHDAVYNPTYLEQAVILEPQDTFLLCTDGFWEYITEKEMEVDWFATQHPQRWLQRMEERLWKRVPSDHDNYTALAVTLH